MNKTNIEWCDSTWNPVVGCKHGCEYCYARRIAKRFGGYDKGDGTITTHNPLPRAELHQPLTVTRSNGKTVNSPFPFGFEPTLLYSRLEEPQRIKKPQTIFVCSMADLFGSWVPDEWIEAVFEACEKAPQHRYLFLTKNPARYYKLALRGKLPQWNNYWYGSTITNPYDIFWFSSSYNTFVSVEPILAEFPPERMPSFELVKLVILGAMTGPGSKERAPGRETVCNIVKAVGSPIFMKDSLAPIVGEENMRRELPWIARKSGGERRAK